MTNLLLIKWNMVCVQFIFVCIHICATRFMSNSNSVALKQCLYNTDLQQQIHSERNTMLPYFINIDSHHVLDTENVSADYRNKKGYA